MLVVIRNVPTFSSLFHVPYQTYHENFLIICSSIFRHIANRQTDQTINRFEDIIFAVIIRISILNGFYKSFGEVRLYVKRQQANLTNPPKHLFHIPQCTIQNRIMRISVLVYGGEFWGYRTYVWRDLWHDVTIKVASDRLSLRTPKFLLPA